MAWISGILMGEQWISEGFVGIQYLRERLNIQCGLRIFRDGSLILLRELVIIGHREEVSPVGKRAEQDE
jgi:hypothetical protein